MRNLFLTITLFISLTVLAEDNEKKGAMSVGADIVSSYIWRGIYFSGTSIQPSMELAKGGFAVGAWGSVDVAGTGYKEVDLFASYSFSNFTVGLFEFWVAGEYNYHYFDFSKNTLHLVEAWLTYSFDRIPLSLSWFTVFAGDENFSKHYVNDKFKKAFPTYIEATYSLPVKEVNLEAAVGVSPWQSSVLYTRYDEGGRTDGFAVINLSLKASRKIRVTEKYSLSIYNQLIYNPAKENAFLVFGLKL